MPSSDSRASKPSQTNDVPSRVNSLMIGFILPAFTTGQPFSAAARCITREAYLSRPPQTSGTPGRSMPAFSAAIFDVVPPSMAVWSSDIPVMTDRTCVFTALVASSLPPRPASSTTGSAPCRRKKSIATAVISSNSVGLSSISSAYGLTVLTISASSSSEIGSPSKTIRSLNFSM